MSRFFCKKWLTNFRFDGKIYRRSAMAAQKMNLGVFPSGQWGQTVNLLLFSFGGSNPPAPTKKTSVENTLVFCFARHLKSHPRGWIRTASTRRTVRRGKKPLRGFFRCAACAIHPRPPKSLSVYKYAEAFVLQQGWTHRAGGFEQLRRCRRRQRKNSPVGCF